MIFKRKMKPLSVTLVFFFVFLLMGPYLSAWTELPDGTPVAEASATQPIGNLQVGDRVVDNSWEWEHRTDNNYSGTGETKPVTWIVVAKNHYSGGDAGSVDGGAGHVTLVTEEIIGMHLFDNSSNRGHTWGSNHWGNSGHPNATRGIRKFLNGSSYSGSDTNSYAHTFYDAMSLDFQSGVLTTTLPNKVWDTGTSYTTADKVFLPSSTELGDTSHTHTYPIGSNWGYFTDNAHLMAQLAGNDWHYWTRSPVSLNASAVRYVHSSGGKLAIAAHRGVRPALNLSSGISVSGTPNTAGYYEIMSESTEIPVSKSFNIFAVNGYEQDKVTEVGKEIKVYALAEGYTNPVYQFFVRTPGDDNWDMQPAQAYSENNHFTFSDTNLEGRYYFVVWVKEAGTPGNTIDPVGRGGFDDFAWTPGYPYLIGNAPIVAPGSVSLSAEPSFAQVGNTITLTVNDYSGVDAEYKFYVKTPSGEWEEFNPDRDWNRSSTFQYTITEAGTYSFSVWARAVGETVERYDTWAWIPSYISRP